MTASIVRGANGAARPGPLTGIRVFDIGHAGVGPWSGMLLGALGADVLKVESPEGDRSHSVPPFMNGLGILYLTANLNKRGIVLDLKDERQREVAHQILAKADVFVENMRPGTVERLGLDYDTVSRINPRIVYASGSAWGNRGPMGRMTGTDTSVQSFSGWASLNGAPGGQWERFRHFAHLDLNTASFIMSSILQGLLVRERTGKGTRVDITMIGASMNLQTTRLAEYFATGRSPLPLGSAASTTAPHQAFLCQERRWLAVGVVHDEQWRGFCRALNLGDLVDDPRFATNPARVANRADLTALLEPVFLTKPSTWWMIRLTKEGVPNGPFLGFNELRYHQHVVENEFMVSVDYPQSGPFLFGGLPFRLDRTPATLGPGPTPGQHSAEILDELGIRADESLTRLPKIKVGAPI